MKTTFGIEEIVFGVLGFLMVSAVFYFVLIYPRRVPRPKRNASVPQMVRHNTLSFDLNKCVIVFKKSGIAIYRTLKGTYILYSYGVYGNNWEIISLGRMKLFLINNYGYEEAIRYFPEIKEEISNLTGPLWDEAITSLKKV